MYQTVYSLPMTSRHKELFGSLGSNTNWFLAAQHSQMFLAMIVYTNKKLFLLLNKTPKDINLCSSTNVKRERGKKMDNHLLPSQQRLSSPRSISSGYSMTYKHATKITTKLRDRSPRANNIDRRLSAKLVPTFADRRSRVVSATDPHGRIFGFSYFCFHVVPQLYPRE
jgi:hypothetical protein